MKIFLFLILYLVINVVNSQGLGPDSDRCLKYLLPRINRCDRNIGGIEKRCNEGIANIDVECKGKNTIKCGLRYLQLEKRCQDKRKAYNYRCKPLYAAHNKECTGPPVKPKSGPESDRCLRVLVSQMATCDSEIAEIDKYCNKGFKKIDKECNGEDTVECGLRYNQFTFKCKELREVYKSKCGPIYASFSHECSRGPKSAPAKGPESDLCMKQLLPEINKCDAEIATIDKECTEGLGKIETLCKERDTIECGLKTLQFEKGCKDRRQAYTKKCKPIYKRHKKECTGAPTVPSTGPESDRCLKQLVPALAICDADASKVTKFCTDGFKDIDQECKGKDTVECGVRYTQFTAECDEKQMGYKNKCDSINAEYKSECVRKKENKSY